MWDSVSLSNYNFFFWEINIKIYVKPFNAYFCLGNMVRVTNNHSVKLIIRQFIEIFSITEIVIICLCIF